MYDVFCCSCENENKLVEICLSKTTYFLLIGGGGGGLTEGGGLNKISSPKKGGLLEGGLFERGGGLNRENMVVNMHNSS